MRELRSSSKNKVHLPDYDYKKDIQNRILISQLTNDDIRILEEILHRPSTISVPDLLRDLNMKEDIVETTLKKFEKSNLFRLEKNTIYVNKGMRKYYDQIMIIFDRTAFIPNLDFLQNLLKKVPIHILPVWYHIPRTANNIFDSLVEKYLLTPQIFHRYLKELNLGSQILTNIVEDVFRAPGLKLTAKQIREKYSLSQEEFEEYILHLEFHFVCCVGYEKVGDHWEEFVTPFQEWREYLLFLESTIPLSIPDTKNIKLLRPGEYPFIEDLSTVLLTYTEPKPKKSPFPKEYTTHLTNYLQQLDLLKLGKITSDGKDWLQLSLEKRALFIYRHPGRAALIKKYSHVVSDKYIREVEKSLQRIIDKGWLYFDDFMKGFLVPLSENTRITLKRIGRRWKYALPEYSTEEKTFVREKILNELYECGLICKGVHKTRECFTLSPLGKSLFS
ncbi:MAG: hypothetical protein ACRCSV_02305 [Chlamydiales bacterium]